MFPLSLPYPFAPDSSGFKAAWAARQQNRLIGARMYPRNAASPGRLYLGPVVQISDGAVQTSGVAVTVTPFGGSETSGAGTIAYSTKGGVWYTPTQAETDYTSFVIEASKTGCIPAGVVVVTTASSTSGTVLLAPVTHTSAVVPTVSAVTAGVNVTQIDGSSAAAVNLKNHALRAVSVTFAAGGTTTTAVLDLVDGAAASSTNDVYNGRVLVFSGPSGLKDQATNITAYNGATKTATFPALTTAVGATATAVLV